MVVDQIHVAGMHAVEAKHDAPVAGHADRPVTGQVALQRMQPEARQIPGRSRRLVETGQNGSILLSVCWRIAWSPLLVVEAGAAHRRTPTSRRAAFPQNQPGRQCPPALAVSGRASIVGRLQAEVEAPDAYRASADCVPTAVRPGPPPVAQVAVDASFVVSSPKRNTGPWSSRPASTPTGGGTRSPS